MDAYASLLHSAVKAGTRTAYERRGAKRHAPYVMVVCRLVVSSCDTSCENMSGGKTKGNPPLDGQYVQG